MQTNVELKNFNTKYEIKAKKSKTFDDNIQDAINDKKQREKYKNTSALPLEKKQINQTIKNNLTKIIKQNSLNQ